jgi:L-ascorbate metabolism protein UlaG (beta-lactamase superfamily)
MIISYHGAECVKVTHGDATLAFNPVSKQSKLKSASFGADIVFVSLNHPDMNGIEQATRGDKQPFAVVGPGEYEVRDIFARGFGTRSQYGGSEKINTSYLVTLEGMNICYLGAVGEAKLPTSLIEAIDTIDILFVPIGGDGVLTPAQAHELSVGLEAKVVIPIHYGEIGEKDALKKFLKEEGSSVKPVEKLTIKKKDLEGKEGDVVILTG